MILRVDRLLRCWLLLNIFVGADIFVKLTTRWVREEKSDSAIACTRTGPFTRVHRKWPIRAILFHEFPLESFFPIFSFAVSITLYVGRLRSHPRAKARRLVHTSTRHGTEGAYRFKGTFWTALNGHKICRVHLNFYDVSRSRAREHAPLIRVQLVACVLLRSIGADISFLFIFFPLPVTSCPSEVSHKMTEIIVEAFPRDVVLFSESNKELDVIGTARDSNR